MRGEHEVARFANEMRRKLRTPKNADKGGWKGENPVYLLWRMSQEFAELEEALFANGGKPDTDAVRSECADVALFAMMICDVTGGLK